MSHRFHFRHGIIDCSSKADTVLNILSTVFWSLSAYFVYAFLNAAAETSVNIITGSVSPFFAVGIALFLANVIINIAVSKNSKTKKPQIRLWRKP